MRGRRPVRALASRVCHDRHRRVPDDSEHKKEKESRHLAQKLKPFHSLVIAFCWIATWFKQDFGKPRTHQVLDEMTRVLHSSEKSQKFSPGLF